MTRCLHGKCVSDTYPVPVSMTKCEEPRPDENTCGTVYYFRKPDPVYCITDQSGVYKDYVR